MKKERKKEKNLLTMTFCYARASINIFAFDNEEREEKREESSDDDFI